MNNRWQIGTRAALFIVHCALFISVAACGGGGGGNNATGPVIADLGGERNPQEYEPRLPAFDTSGAPTDAHRVLAGLVPVEALVKDSVVYGGWDSLRCEVLADNAKSAPLPALSAHYEAASFKLHREGPASNDLRAEIEYPQTCFLTLIRAPEPMAAEALAAGLRDHLLGPDKGFKQQDPLAIGTTKEGTQPEIRRMLRIDTHGDRDKVYVVYVMVIGSLVVYALEVEYPPALKGPGGEQIKRVLDGQRGSRVGARLVALIHHQLNP